MDVFWREREKDSSNTLQRKEERKRGHCSLSFRSEEMSVAVDKAVMVAVFNFEFDC